MYNQLYNIILVGGLNPLKNMSSSVGVTIPNIWKVIKFMFQTTNQIIIIFPLLLVYSLLTTINHY